MKRFGVMALVLAMVAVAAMGIYVAAADEAPGMQQGKPAAVVAPVAQAQAFTYKHPLEILAEVSGKSLDEVRTLVAGKGVWEVIEELKVVDKFTKAFSDYKLAMVDYLVSVGKVSKEDAAAFKTEFAAKVAAGELGKDFAGECGLNLGMGAGRGMMGGRGGNGGCGGCGMNGNTNTTGKGFGGNTVQRQGMMGGRWN